MGDFGKIFSPVTSFFGGLFGGFQSSPKGMKSTNMAPATIDSFSISMCEEGAVVPLIFGRVRTNGNILWYGNLTSEEVSHIEKVKAGKKKKKVKVTDGYIYRLNLWQAMSRANYSLVEIYADNTKLKLSGINYSYAIPPQVGDVGALKGIKHIYFPQYELGMNTTAVPTFHFVLDGADSNPAAVMRGLLQEAGATDANIDMPSFNKVTSLYSGKGYSLNISFSEQSRTSDCLDNILKYAGGMITEKVTLDNTTFKFILPDATDQSVAGLSENDFLSFKMERVSQENSPNYLTAQYIDANKNYTKRALAVKNTAAIRRVGRIDKSVDLTAFIYFDAANRRLAEILREVSFPAARFSFKVGLRHSWMEVGDLVTLSHSEWGISGLKARITHRELAPPDVDGYSYQAELAAEFLQEAYFEPIEYVPEPEVQPVETVNLTKVRFFELPRTTYNNTDPVLLVLASRELGIEHACAVMVTTDGMDYDYHDDIVSFAQMGQLSKAYPVDTFAIDDEIGITYKPRFEDPKFDTISREALFKLNRMALIGDELLAFQTVTLNKDETITLTGIIRGLYQTPKAAYNVGTEIWLFPNTDGLAIAGLPQSGKIKLLPQSFRDGLAEADATARPFAITGKAAIPWPVARIEAVRQGTTVNITLWPANVEPFGAGVKDETKADGHPFEFTGEFLYGINNGNLNTELNSTTLTLENAARFNFSVRVRENGKLSAVKTLTVEAADGVYSI